MSSPDEPRPRTIAFVTLRGFYTGLAHRVQGDTPRPLIVGRRGEVLEASRDLTFAGIRPGMSRREAAYAAPEALWVEYEPELCLPAAEKFWQACASLTPRVEPVADHEVFLDLTGTAGAPGFTAMLRQALDLPDLAVYCGFAGNRLVARLAAERAVAEAHPLPAGERDACRAIPPGGEAAFLAALPVSALWTIPAEVREALVRLGLTTAGAVFSVPEEAFYRLFGPEAFRLLRHARGEDSSPVPFFEAALAARSSSGAVLQQAVDFGSGAGWPELETPLRRAAQLLATDLAASGRSCLRLHFTLWAAEGATRQTTLTPQDPPASGEAFFTLAAGAVRRLLAREGFVPRRLLVELELAHGAAQLSLPASFAAASPAPAGPPGALPPTARSTPPAAVLGEVLAAVNRTFAREVLFPAARLTLSRRERLRRLLPGFGHAAP